MEHLPTHGRRRHGRWLTIIVALVTGLSYVAIPAAAAAGFRAGTGMAAATAPAQQWSQPGPGYVVNETGEPGADTYIVLHQAPSLAQYRGEVPGLAATSPEATGATRLDAGSAASQAYLAYLAGRHDDLVAAIDAELGRSVEVEFRYDAVLNGIAVVMDANEALAVSSLDGVRRVERDSVRHLLTDNGPRWIGADAVWGEDPVSGSEPCVGTCGEGIVAGIIDTGINFDHPSFADVGGDGYDHTNPRLTFFGACDPVTGLPFCNDKLIGYYDFTGTGPEDDNGHGSHTASTTAGNVLTATLNAPTINLERNISGVAPHANIISYKGCSGTPVGCVLSALVASINQATLDGVDVINYSIGGSSSNPWADLDAQAFFDAYTAGIFVATSAGNSGPDFGTMGSPADAPWVTSVGASTHDRQLANGLVDLAGGNSAAPADIEGKGITDGYGPARVVYAGDYAAQSNDPANAHLCGSGVGDPATGEGSGGQPWPAGTFNGEIVVCDRGEYGRVHKGENVLAAGAGGYILANDAGNGDSLVADTHVLPAVHISFDDGVVLKAWLADGAADHTGRIRGLVPGEDPGNADNMASFSSRGANPAAPSLIKPDVTAPGVDVFAAWMTPAGALGGDPEFNIISGTSMSSPHTAGAGALVLAANPTWSPDQVKSALMTTAFTTTPGNGDEVHGVFKEDGATPADPFDMGSGRVDLHVATRAGLVLDETVASYEAANPGLGGDATALNIASMGNDFCASSCAWVRTVEGTAAGTVNWTVTTTAEAGMTLTVSPASFSLAPGDTQDITVVANVDAVSPKGNWTFGEVRLTPDDGSVPPAHLPVAVVPQSGPLPTVLHMHGNIHDDCVGDGATDVATGAGICQPHLSTDSLLDTAPPARWGPIRATGPNGTAPQNIHDPNWIWELDAPTTVAGSMTVEWWWGGPAVNTVLFDDFFIRLFADGVLVKEERVRHNVTAPNVPELLRSTVTVPATRATSNFVLQIDPIFLNQNDSFIYYDSQQQCPGVIGAVPCDSRVSMPVLDQPDPPPVAEDDNAFVGRGGTVVVDVLANDVDNGPLAVRIVSGPANGTADVTLDNKISYTHDDSATTSDSLVYEVTDTAGQKDQATVFITVDPGCTRTATLFSDDFESGANGWTVDTAVNTPPSQSWVQAPDVDAPSPVTVWFTDALASDGISDTTKDVRLVSPAVTLGSASTLTFWHRFNTEVEFDGGVLEVSTDGSTWEDITAAGGKFVVGGYNSTVTPGSSFVLSGREAWTGFADDYPFFEPVEVTLGGTLADQTVQFRWRFAQDQLVPTPGGGWWVDDVTFADSEPCHPPVANDDSATVNEGQSVNVDVKANDFDPDDDPGDLTVAIESGPAHGNVIVEADGTITYTHNGDNATADSFRYRLTDPDDQFDTATVSVTIVQDPNPAPDAVDDAATVDAGRSVTVDVKANDSDANHTNDELTVSIETPPAHGSAQVTADGQITYTHNGDSAASDSFRYRLTDPEDAFDIATVTITIIQDTRDTGDKVTGGGYLLPIEGKKVNFGFNAKAKSGGFQGHLTLSDKSAGVKVKLDEVTSLGAVQGACGEVPAGSASAEFTGDGTFNGDAASFRVCVADLGEPGNSGSGGADLFHLECTAGCSYSTADRTADDAIDGGNIQVHRSTEEAGTTDAAQANQADDPGTNSSSSGPSASVLILDPLLLTESSAAVEALTVTAYDAGGEPLAGVAVALDSVGADGVVTTLDAVTDVAGLAVFTVSVAAGDVEHIARSGLLTSNAIDITGLL